MSTMSCNICGCRCEWKGSIGYWTHTQCMGCGAINSHERPEPEPEDEEEEE